MPKVKTHSRAKKTFRLTASGEIRYYKSNKRHLLSKKSKPRKRRLNSSSTVSPANKPFVERLLRLR